LRQSLVLDGPYRSDADGVPEVIEAAAPTEETLHALLQTVFARLVKRLTGRGMRVEDDGPSYHLAESDTEDEEAPALRPLQVGAVPDRVAFGPRAGRKGLTLRGAGAQRDAAGAGGAGSRRSSPTGRLDLRPPPRGPASEVGHAFTAG